MIHNTLTDYLAAATGLRLARPAHPSHMRGVFRAFESHESRLSTYLLDFLKRLFT